MPSVAHFITGHEQTQTESAVSILLTYSLPPKDLTLQNLFVFTAAGVMSFVGRKTSIHLIISSACQNHIPTMNTI